MHDDQAIRHIDPNDQIDAATPQKARAELKPDHNAVRDAGSAADHEDKARNDEQAEGGNDHICLCDDIEKAIIAHLDVVEGPSRCRMGGLANVLAKECCDHSRSSAEAMDIATEAIQKLRRRVEKIICSDDYAKRTGAGAVMLDGNSLLSALVASALGGRLKN